MASNNVLVIAPARSGSTLLGLGLGSHPGAVYAGEIAMWGNKWGKFVDNDLARRASRRHFGRRGFSPELINPALPWRPHPNITPQTAAVEAYFRDLLSSPGPQAIVGKITFDTMPIGHALWPCLLDLDPVLVLLQRRNLLETLVSWKVAFETKIWNVGADAQQPTEAVSVELDPLEVLHYFVTTESHLGYWSTVLENRDGILVDYDELISDWDQTMAHLFRRLGWVPATVEAKLQKRTRGELPTLVSNYAQLESFFAGSRWEPFFR